MTHRFIIAGPAHAWLVTAGYPVDDVLNMLVEGINNLHGADPRYDRFRPGSPEWLEAIALMEKFFDEGSLVVDRFRWNDPYSAYAYPAESITPEMWITTLSTGARRWVSCDGGTTFLFASHEMAPAVWMDRDVRESPDGRRLLALLNVQPDIQKKIWVLEPARVADGADLQDLPDRPRPSLKLLLSMKIRYSDHVPDSAFQSVRYRGLWFYIDDRDIHSKAGFNALYDLWQLSVKSPSTQSQPVTTIQVN